MKKIIKFTSIGIVVVLVLLIAAIAILPLVLPLDKFKDMATEKISETMGREVRLGKLSFNIFSGVKLSDLYIGNRKGFSKTPFVSADAIEFRYSFWKLLTGKIEITKAVLVKPEILIEKLADGTTNYSDLTGPKKPRTEKTVTKNNSKKKGAIALLVSKFAISKGNLTMVLHTPNGKKTNQLKDLNLDISNISLKTENPILINFSVMGVYEGKSVPIKMSTKIRLDLEKAYAKIEDLLISAANEKLLINAEVSKFNAAPNIKVNIGTKGVDLDKFMAVLSGSKKKKTKEKPAPLPYGQKTRSINKSLKSIPYGMVANAYIDLNNIKFRSMRMDSLKINISLKKKIATIKIDEIKAYNGKISGVTVADLNVSGIKYSVKDLGLAGFDAAPFANDVVESFLTGMEKYQALKDKIEGTLNIKLALSGQGVETTDIIANAKVNGSFALKNGKVKKLKSLEGVSDKLGISTLKHDIEIKEFSSSFSLANKVANIPDLIMHNGDDGDTVISFKGKASLETMKFIKGNVLSLKINPRLAKDLPSDYEAFKDNKGWAKLEFELTGSVKKPIPIPKLDKPAQKIINKEVDKASEQLKKQLEEQAKDLFKF